MQPELVWLTEWPASQWKRPIRSFSASLAWLAPAAASAHLLLPCLGASSSTALTSSSPTRCSPVPEPVLLPSPPVAAGVAAMLLEAGVQHKSARWFFSRRHAASSRPPSSVVVGLRHHHHRRHPKPVARPPICRIERSSAGAWLPPPRPALSSAGSGSRRSVLPRRIRPTAS